MSSMVFRPMSSTRLCIVRHGETDWNAAQRIQGQTDVGLNARGLEQARVAAETLLGEHFSAIYSSDLLRARETAQVAGNFLHLPVLLEPGLRERNYGEYEGLTRDEIKARADYARYVSRDVDFDFVSGEPLWGFAERIKATLNRLAQRHRGENLLLFAHGGVLDVVYRIATQRPLETARDFPIPNAGLNWIEIGNPDWCLEAWGVLAAPAGDLQVG